MGDTWRIQETLIPIGWTIAITISADHLQYVEASEASNLHRMHDAHRTDAIDRDFGNHGTPRGCFGERQIFIRWVKSAAIGRLT